MFLCVRAYRMIFTSSLSLSLYTELTTLVYYSAANKQITLTDGWYDAGAAVDTTQLN